MCLLTLPFCRRSNSQAPNIQMTSTAFKEELASLLKHSVPVISVDQLHDAYDQYIIVDARSLKEFQTSHLPGAHFIDYGSVSGEKLAQLPSDRPIVVYCSVGYRSEKVAERLQKAGYPQVYNLYGSIFEWVNKGYSVVDDSGDTTYRVHTYNKKWGRWVTHPDAVKVTK